MRQMMLTLVCATASLTELASVAVAAPPEEPAEHPAWVTTTIKNGRRYTEQFFFMPNATLVYLSHEIVPDGQAPKDIRNLVGFYTLNDHKLTIEWTLLRQNQMKFTGKETGILTRTAEDSLLYTITKHDNAKQVGVRHELTPVRFPKRYVDAMASLAASAHRLKVKQLRNDKVKEAYQHQIDQIKSAIDDIIR